MNSFDHMFGPEHRRWTVLFGATAQFVVTQFCSGTARVCNYEHCKGIKSPWSQMYRIPLPRFGCVALASASRTSRAVQLSWVNSKYLSQNTSPFSACSFSHRDFDTNSCVPKRLCLGTQSEPDRQARMVMPSNYRNQKINSNNQKPRDFGGKQSRRYAV